MKLEKIKEFVEKEKLGIPAVMFFWSRPIVEKIFPNELEEVARLYKIIEET